MRILIGVIGTGGDLYPCITLAKGLQARGHEVIIISGQAYREAVEAAGVLFHGTGLDAANIRTSQITDARPLTTKEILQDVAERMVNLPFAPLLDAVQALVNDDTLLMYNLGLQLAGGSASEKFNLPAIHIDLAPIGLQSNAEPPRVSADDVLYKIPTFLRKMGIVTFLTNTVGRAYFKPLDKWRVQYGLPKIPVCRRYEYINSFDMPERKQILCLFPEWFAKPIHNWSANRLPYDLPLQIIKTTGFMLPQQASHQTLSLEVKAFLEKYPRPVLFTFGTGMLWDGMKDFFQVSVNACQQLNLPVILLSRNSNDFPADLPANVLCVNFLGLETLLPQVGLIVYHGGVGTMACALAAQVPHLVVPFRHDQFDNATRICNLGVGDELATTDYTVENLANKIAARLKDAKQNPEKYTRLAELTQQSGGAHAVEKACDFVEKFYREYKQKT